MADMALEGLCPEERPVLGWFRDLLGLYADIKMYHSTPGEFPGGLDPYKVFRQLRKRMQELKVKSDYFPPPVAQAWLYIVQEAQMTFVKKGRKGEGQEEKD